MSGEITMKNNPYDNETFFNEYSKMARSQFGLEAAGEWETMIDLLPNLEGLNILDLGCGYGWHCAYFKNKKANKILGIDISEKMIKKAKEINLSLNIEYLVKDFYSLNDINDSYDLVFSSLAIHYIQDFENLTKQVRKLLKPKGTFLFSVEHPIFTAEGSQQ